MDGAVITLAAGGYVVSAVMLIPISQQTTTGCVISTVEPQPIVVPGAAACYGLPDFVFHPVVERRGRGVREIGDALLIVGLLATR